MEAAVKPDGDVNDVREESAKVNGGKQVPALILQQVCYSACAVNIKL
jgi:hypothetical protein